MREYADCCAVHVVNLVPVFCLKESKVIVTNSLPLINSWFLYSSVVE